MKLGRAAAIRWINMDLGFLGSTEVIRPIKKKKPIPLESMPAAEYGGIFADFL